MDDSDPLAKPFDVAVIGTGISSSILAAAAARCGASVLHVEVTDVYGGIDGTISLRQFSESVAGGGGHAVETPQAQEEGCAVSAAAPPGWNVTTWLPAGVGAPAAPIRVHCDAVPDAVAAVARKVQLDLWPRLTYCRGGATNVLVESGVSNYLEYKALEADALVTEEQEAGAGPSGGSAHAHAGGAAATAGQAAGQAKLVAQPVPAGKGDVFSHSDLSLSDKRRLMKLLQFVMDTGLEDDVATPAEGVNEVQLGSGRSLLRPQNKGAPAYDLAAYRDKSISAFLADAGVEGKLRTMLLHAVALVDTDAGAAGAGGGSGASSAPAARQPDAASGVHRLHAHVSSLGRFGSSAYLCTMYGGGEVSQAFCRSCAVHGGVYMLRTKVQAWGMAQAGPHVDDKEKDKPAPLLPVPAGDGHAVALRLLDDSGRPTSVHVRRVLLGPGQQAALPDAWRAGRGEAAEHIAVVVCLLRGQLSLPGLPAESGLFHGIIPPGHGPAHAPQAIHLLQAGQGTAVCPPGYAVLHCMTRVVGGEEEARAVAEAVRTKLVPTLAQAEGSGEDSRPSLLWHASYLLPVPSSASVLSPSAPANITIIPGHLEGETSLYSYLTLDGPVAAAREGWRVLAGAGTPMFPPKQQDKDKGKEKEEDMGEGEAGTAGAAGAAGGSSDASAASSSSSSASADAAAAPADAAPSPSAGAAATAGEAAPAPAAAAPAAAAASDAPLDVQSALQLLDSSGLLDDL